MRALEYSGPDALSIESVERRRAAVRTLLDDLGPLPECLGGCSFLLVEDTGRWGALSQQQRRHLGTLGVRRRGGRGLCTACYFRARRDGALATFMSGPGELGRCTRCAVEAGLEDGICGDCRHVCSDLGELERWAS